MRALLLITAAIVACAGPVAAQNWAVVSASDDTVTALDFDSIRTSGNRRIFWDVRAHSTTRGSAPGDMGDYVVARKEVDCVEERYRLLSFNVLLFDGTSLGVLDNPVDWVAIFPDTVASTTMNLVCRPLSDVPHGFETARDFAQNARRVFEEDAR